MRFRNSRYIRHHATGATSGSRSCGVARRVTPSTVYTPGYDLVPRYDLHGAAVEREAEVERRHRASAMVDAPIVRSLLAVRVLRPVPVGEHCAAESSAASKEAG